MKFSLSRARPVTIVLAYLLPPAIKLKDAALAIVIAIGIVMMLVDLYQSLRKNDGFERCIPGHYHVARIEPQA